MTNIQNALLLKYLSILKQLGYNYTDKKLITDNQISIDLPSNYEDLRNIANKCHLCQLSKGRKHVVFGNGSLNADLMFVGYVPGIDEDESGDIFTGKKSQILTKMIENVLGMQVNEIYYSNILKCKPLQPLQGKLKEANICNPFIQKEIEIVSPKLIVCLGEEAYSTILNDSSSFADRRGEIFKLNNYHLMPTFDPSFLDRNPSAKKDAMQDLQTIKQFLKKLH